MLSLQETDQFQIYTRKKFLKMFQRRFKNVNLIEETLNFQRNIKQTSTQHNTTEDNKTKHNNIINNIEFQMVETLL